MTVLPREAPSAIDWVVSFGTRTFNRTQGAFSIHDDLLDTSLEISRDLSGQPAQFARAGRVAVLFEGTLYNRVELQAEAGLVPPAQNDAAVLLSAYARWGRDLPAHVKGVFALVVWDGANGSILAVRDPLGQYPLFYAAVPGRGVLLSTSIDALLADSRVSRAVSRPALADHLCQRWSEPQETFFEAVKRVPAGHQLVAGIDAVRVERYWDPLPPGRPVKWVTEEEFETFDAKLDTAVARAMSHGPSGVFLSGGLDSISVGTVAADVARRTKQPAPLALSLGYPQPCDETFVQRRVAASLGIDQELVPFWTAVPAGTLMTRALAITRTLSSPLMSPWAAAYNHLTERAKRRGVQTIMTGNGGDELFGANVLYTADLWRTGNVAGLVRHAAKWRRSYQFPAWPLVKAMTWTFGWRPLGVAFLERTAPRLLNRRRVRRSMAFAPSFVAPDAALKSELEARLWRAVDKPRTHDSIYLSDVRAQLSDAMSSWQLEQLFERSRQSGVRLVHPLWDADVADMMYRMPQPLLAGDGRAKYPLRRMLARRFPGLGLDSQKKLAATPFFRSVLAAELPGVWSSMRGTPALVELRVVDGRQAAEMVEQAFQRADRRSLGKVWELMNLEAWAASRI